MSSDAETTGIEPLPPPMATICKLCGGREYRLRILAPDPDGVSTELNRLVQCSGCGVTFVHPIPSEIGRYYFNAYYKTPSRAVSGVVRWILDFLYRYRVGKFSDEFRPGSRVLDVGCGEGNFLVAMARSGWDVAGIETSPAGFERAKGHLGDRVTLTPLMEGEARWPKEHFDLITFWHSFEHMADPRSVLTYARRLLKPDGTLFLAVPNIAGWEFRFFGKKWFHLDLPRHLYQYTPETLGNLLRETGFSVKRLNHDSWEYNPFGFYQSTLNILCGETNFLYKRLKGIGKHLWSDVFGWFIVVFTMPVLLPAAFVAAFFSARAQAGGCVEIHVRRPTQ